MTAWRVLVVDDDRELRMSLVDLLEAAGMESRALARAAEVDRWIGQFRPDVILSDVRMPGISGLELLESLAPTDAPPVVLISAHGDIPMAVAAMQAGAYSFVEKPYEPRRLLSILTHAAEQYRMRGTNNRLRARLLQLSGLNDMLLGQTPAIRAVRDDITNLTDSPLPVLIQGETGTGKDLVARALHDLGPQSGGPFVAIAPVQITLEQLAACARAAHGGTLYLDEILACPAELQTLLLRLVEDQQVLGPSGPEQLNLRVISATNADVDQALDNGTLRQDLHFRLAATQVTLPPLKDRRDDIMLLATHFLAGAARSYEIDPPDLTQEDLATLLAHDWPGNLRELRNAAERRVLMARRGTGSMAAALHPSTSEDDIPHTLREAVAAFEREMIAKSIKAHRGRMDAVAEALGIGRRTLNEKVVKLGLDKDALL